MQSVGEESTKRSTVGSSQGSRRRWGAGLGGRVVCAACRGAQESLRLTLEGGVENLDGERLAGGVLKVKGNLQGAIERHLVERLDLGDQAGLDTTGRKRRGGSSVRQARGGRLFVELGRAKRRAALTSAAATRAAKVAIVLYICSSGGWEGETGVWVSEVGGRQREVVVLRGRCWQTRGSLQIGRCCDCGGVTGRGPAAVSRETRNNSGHTSVARFFFFLVLCVVVGACKATYATRETHGRRTVNVLVGGSKGWQAGRRESAGKWWLQPTTHCHQPAAKTFSRNRRTTTARAVCPMN